VSGEDGRPGREAIYESDWVSLYVERVEMPSGRVIERHHFVEHRCEAVVVLARDEAGRWPLVRVWRPTTGTHEWELPAGGVEPGESPLQAARRELLEETGHASDGHRQVLTFYPSNGISRQRAHVVVCRARERKQAPDAGEVSEVRWLRGEEIQGMLERGELRDGFTLVALLAGKVLT
jgi:ADP-ribose pyrophosphatase